MLSEQEKRSIRAQEEAAARRAWARERRLRRGRARAAYRAAVRRELRRRFNPGWLILAALLVALPLAAWRAWPGEPRLEDGAGGIASSALLERCQREVAAQLGQATLRFPDGREAAGQLSASADGKRWDGWAEEAGGLRHEFSCEYTPATDRIHLELIEAEGTP